VNDNRADQVIADFLQAAAAGKEPDRQGLLDQNPDLADELHSFFVEHDRMQAAARRIQDAAAPAATIGLDGPLTPGTAVRYFGDYEVLEEIARGGMGVVYKARQVSLNRTVALKMILSGQLASPADVQRFRAEAEAAAQLDHPNIVPIHEVGEHQGLHYFSMKLIEGESLAERAPQLLSSPKAAARLVAVVARAVHYAHQRGVLHRDLKPANILLDAQGQPHVTDFGLAKCLGADRGQTQSGVILGTPSYMAPEQAGARRDLSTAVDVYSLGTILYELLLGKPPFRADTPLETLRQVVECEPDRPRLRKPGLDADLETVCLKCLHKDPARRYGSALELAEDLERWLAGEPIHARPVGCLEKFWLWCRRNPLIAALVAVVLVVFVDGTAVSILFAVQANQAREEAEGARQHAAEEAREEKEAREAATLSEAKAREQERQVRREKERGDRMLHLAELRLYAGQLAQAQREWQDGNGAAALQVLSGCQWDLRDLEYRLLWTQYTSNQLTLPGQRTLTCVAFSPDGKRILQGSWFDGLEVWDVERRTRLFAIRQYFTGARLNSAAYSPDGKRIVGNIGKLVKVWDAASGKEVFSLEGHKGDVYSVAVSSDGTRLVSGGHDGVLKVWDLQKGQEVRSLVEIPTPVVSVAFSPDGQRIVGGGATVEIWDARSGRVLLKIAHFLVRSVVFSPDGKTIVSGGEDGTLKAWDARTGKELHTLKGHTQPVTAVAVSSDGKRIVSASEDSTVRVWDAQTGREVRLLMGHLREVTCVAFRPDGRAIVSGSPDRTVKLWDAEQGQKERVLHGHTLDVLGLAFSPDGKRLVSAGWDHTLRVWDVDSGREVLSFKGHKSQVGCVAFRPDGKRIVSGSEDSVVKVWDADTGREILSFKQPPFTFGVSSVAFSPDGKRIVTESERDAQVWDAETGQPLLSMKGPGHQAHVSSAAISPDGKRIVTGSYDWTVKLWDAASGKKFRTFRGHTAFVNRVAFSPDGKRIVSSSDDKTLRVWDAQTGEELFTLRGHTKTVQSGLFSPDGKRILSISKGGGVKVWDAATGQDLFTLKVEGVVSRVAISPDGRCLATGCPDGTIKLWDAWKSPLARPLEEDDTLALSIAFSPDSRRLAVGYDHGVVKVWDVRKGQAILTLRGLTDMVRGVAFSADGKRISGLSKREDSEKTLTWDAVTGEVLPEAKPLLVEEQPTGHAVTSPNGSLRARLDDDGKIRVVDLGSAAELAERQREQDRAFLRRLR
jgi:WD40 repeat protein